MKSFVNKNIYEESITVDVVNELMYSLHHLLKKYSDKHYTGYFFAYFDPSDEEKKFSFAYKYLENLQNLKFRLETESTCLCDKEAGKLIEDTRKLVGTCSPLRLDLISDSSKEAEWILNNPNKVPREIWEQCLYTKCGNITFTLARDLNKSKEKCEIVYSLVKAIDKCNYTFNISDKTKKCSPEYDLLLKETKCGISYTDYLTFRDCGADYNLIKTVYSCGGSLDVNLKTNCLEVNYNLKKYIVNCYE